LRVSEEEVFFTVQGEGIYAGVPTVFVRLQGCNLRPGCNWCDTLHAQDPDGGKKISISEVVTSVTRQTPTCRWVCITGGEPLRQEQELHTLVKELKSLGYCIEIETNGTIPPPSWYPQVDCWCADVKCPSSGIYDRTSTMWFHTRPQDQLKFVVADETDLEFVRNVLRTETKILPTILISPAFIDQEVSKDWMQRCVEFVKKYNLRFSLQIHKTVWDPNQKGV